MKKAFFPLAIMIVLLFAFVAVSCNSDLYKPQNDTWAIGEMYFEKFSEAVSWLSSQDASRGVSPGRIIKLLKDVNNAESIIVPQSFSGDVRIDFQWHSYVFSSDNQYFFKVEGGSNVEIVNERAVIPSGSSSSEKAIVVNGAKVVADNLSVDDRRALPQAVSVGSFGSLTISSSSGNTDRKMLGGAFVVSSGSQLVINGGLLEIDSLNQLSDDVLFAINGGTVHYPHEIASFIENAASSQTQMVAIHDISGWIDTDLGVHYKECTHCHARFEEAPHQFSQWTYDSLLGVSTRVCSVCGRVEELDHKHEIVAVPYKEKTCTADGHSAYWHCPVCNEMFSDAEGHSPITLADVCIPASHNLVHVPFSAHTCTEDGVVEHWFCQDCGKAFADQNAAVERTSIVIPAAHQMVYHEPVAATCTASGMFGYWSCSVCGGVFADQLGKQGTTLQNLIVPATGHSPLKREAHEATCGSEGNTEYWICNTCGQLFSDESCSHEIALSDTVVPALVHNPVHTEAVEPTCTSDGNIGYWTCSHCAKVFSDEQCTNELSSSVVVSKLGHLLSHIGAVSATCTAEGNVEYWKCSRCGLLFADEQCADVIDFSDTVVSRTAHSLKHTRAVEPTCLSAGNIEYWTCIECGKHFADSLGTAELASESLVLAKLAHSLEHTDAVAPTCTVGGNIEYWRCAECGRYFSDSQATNQIQAAATVLARKGHSPVHHNYIAPTCTVAGQLEHWTCSDCGKSYLDAACTIEAEPSRLVIEKIGHEVTHVAELGATCTQEGHIEYWQCSRCNLIWSDSGLTDVISSSQTVIPSMGHDLRHVEAIEASCTSTGNTEHWICNTCGCYFSDAGAQHEITAASTVTPVKGHTADIHVAAKSASCTEDGNIEYWECSECGTLFSDSQCRNSVSASDVILGAIGHRSEHHDAVAATCTSSGNIEYWKCLRCGKLFSNSSLTCEITLAQTVVAPLPHSLVHYNYVSATCTEDGSAEHWHCSVCGNDYADADASVLLDDIDIPAYNHDLEHFDAVAATCTEAGHTAYSHCVRCNLYFNASGTAQIELASTVVPALGHTLSGWISTDSAVHYKLCSVCSDHVHEAEHSFGVWTYDSVRDKQINECSVCHRVVEKAHTHLLEFHAAVPHTCISDGNVAYYECTECHRRFSDSSGTVLLVSIVDPASHTLSFVPAVSATCTSEGVVEHWHCSVCGKNYSDSSAALLLDSVVIPVLGHDLDHIDAVSATCTEAGHTAYSHCVRCGLYFNSLGTAQIELASTVIPALGHTLSGWVSTDAEHHWKECSVCHEHLLEEEHSFGNWSYNPESGHQERLCSICGRLEARIHTHVLEFHEAVPHTCTSAGTVAYYECSECHKRFRDEGQTVELASIVDPASHTLIYVPAVAASCVDFGVVEHWHCSVCGKDYSDSSATSLLDSVVIPVLGHDLEHIDAVAATCTEAGHIAYSHCVRCDLYFNAAGTAQIDLASTVVPATGHSVSELISSDAEHHWKECSVCHEHLQEASHIYPEDWTYDPVSGKMTKTCSVCGRTIRTEHVHSLSNLVYHPAVAHTCTENGTIAYYECSGCGNLYKDVNGDIELAVIVDPAAHDLSFVPAVSATCTSTGVVEHWHCSVCGKNYADANGSSVLDSVVIDALGHDLEHIDAVDATCTSSGHVAYSHCVRCDLYFNAAGTAQIELASTVVPALGHTLSDWVSTDAEHHWKECSVCHEHLLEAEHTFGEWTYDSVRDKQVNECTVCHRVVEKAHTHVLEFHSAVPHTCVSDGTVAYYECTECHRRFSDSSGTVLLVSVIDPAAHTLSFVPAVSATCTSAGIVEHWHCSVCGKDYSDGNASVVLDSVTVPALGHDLEHIDGVAATCTSSGHVAYSHCVRCDLYFNAAGTAQIDLASTVVPATGHTLSGWVSTDAEHHWKECSVCHEHLLEAEHTFGPWQYDSQTGLQERFCSVCGYRATKAHSHLLEFHEAVPHTCTTDGNVAYYECTECHRYFRDYAETIELASVVDPASHTLSHVPAVAASCVDFGVVEHWHCSVCGKDFSDAAGKTELQSTVAAKLSHQMTHHAAVAATCTSIGNVEYWSCSECGINYADASGSSVLADVTVPRIAHSLVHHKAVAASCTADGNIEYWECSLCHGLFADDSASIVLQGSVVLPATGHSLVHHDAVEATCTSTGSVEYWHCSICGRNYSDSAASQEIQSLVVPMIAHSAVNHDAVEATCTSSGSIEYWTCSVCSGVFSDSACTHEIDIATTVIPKKAHSVAMVEAKPATCTLSGNIRYWVCSECGKLFSSADCTVEVDDLDVVVPATGHSLAHVDAVEATCTSAGTAEHWHCSICNKDYSDSQGTAELASTFIPMTAHSLVHHSSVPATCTADGAVEYWECSSCSGLFSDEQCSVELTLQMLPVPALDHDLIHSQRVEPTCTSVGNIEYWSCSRCGQLFSDVSGLHEIALSDTVLAAKGHSATGTPAVAATCTADGNSAYWHCSECGKYFSDSACTHEVQEGSWVLGALGHSLEHVAAVSASCTSAGVVEHWYCSVCGKNYSDSLGTSELANVIVPASGHSAVVTAAKAPTCIQAGNTIYWTCSVCGRHFSDERCQNEIAQGSWILSALGHNSVFEPAVAATCTSSGLVEHWHCSVCGHDFSDAQASSDITGSVVVAPLGHSTVSSAAVSPTCTSDGNSAYWTCTACGRHFSDAACTTEISEGSWIIGALGHSLEHVEAVEPTCVENGNIEYWRCTRCSETFEDSEGLVEITGSVVLAATGHSFSGYEFDESRHWLECSVCHAQVNAGTHQWGEEKDCLDGHHRVHECSVCGAFKNETVAGYQIINTSIGTISVPLAESAPCGTMKIVRIGNTVKVKFVANINSNPNYSVTCRYLKGTWSDYLVPDADGYYAFNVDGTSNYKIVIQAYNGGGTSVYETTIR